MKDSALTTYSANTLNQYTEIETPGTTRTLSYDPDGNLIEDGERAYTWDAEPRHKGSAAVDSPQANPKGEKPPGRRSSQNRLVSAQTSTIAIANGATPEKLVFTYDSENRRVSKSVLGWSGTDYSVVADHRLFLYDNTRMIAEVGFSGTTPVVEKSYYWGLDLAGWRDGQSMDAAGGIGGLWMIQSGTNAYFPMYDAMGNVLSLAEAGTNEKVASYRYDPWGNLLSVSGTAADVSSFGFQTRERDTTGLIYFPGDGKRPGRYYNPRTGKFLSNDPMEESGGLNLPGYCLNDPINRLDPFGQKSKSAFTVSMRTYHFYSDVYIGFVAGDDPPKGKCPCKHPKLSQIVNIYDFNGLKSIVNPSGWRLDGGVFYPYQKPAYRSVTMEDHPGAYFGKVELGEIQIPIPNPLNVLHGMRQDFETVAICTDDGPGKYWIIGGVQWGHVVGGAYRSSNYGDGTWSPSPASGDFRSLFPANLLGP